MWVVFRKSDGKVISATSEPPGQEKTALEEIVRGLEGAPPIADFEAVEVKETGVLLGPREGSRRQELTVRSALGGKMEVVDATPEPSFIKVTTDARDFHPVDNVPLMPGNGTSYLVVTLQKMNEKGTPLVSASTDDDVIWLRTDHGALRADVPEAELMPEIRSITLVSGKARFRLYSEKARRLATVQMLSANPDLNLPALQVEFI